MALLATVGCAARSPRLGILVPAPCLSAPVRLLGCNGENPPHCTKVIIRYKPGCEVVDAGR